MAVQLATLRDTRRAKVDLTTNQYCLVKIDPTLNTLELATAATDTVAGVLDYPGNVGQVCHYNVEGFPKLKMGAAAPNQAKLAPGAGGKAVVATSGQPYFAILQEPSSADRQICRVLMEKGVA